MKLLQMAKKFTDGFKEGWNENKTDDKTTQQSNVTQPDDNMTHTTTNICGVDDGSYEWYLANQDEYSQ